MGMFLASRKKDYTTAGSAVTPLLFGVTIILFQKAAKFLFSEFQHRKMTDKLGNSK